MSILDLSGIAKLGLLLGIMILPGVQLSFQETIKTVGVGLARKVTASSENSETIRSIKAARCC